MATPPYFFMAWCLIKHTDNFTTLFMLPFIDNGFVRFYAPFKTPNFNYEPLF
jgi:hypothetical protein